MKFEFDYQCDKEWDEMKGGDRRRYCDSCDKHVHHISAMSKEDALKFLEDRNWDVCVDFFADAKSGDTVFAEKQARLQGQMDGLKQLMASALAVVPLALAAAFIDFDQAEPAQIVQLPVNDISPVELGGPTPVIVKTTPNFTFTPPPVFEPPPVIEELPDPVVPVVEDLPEPDPQPIIKPPRVHLRGKVARPADLPDPLTDL